MEDMISFATNFLTQILTIIATGILVGKYIITENRKGQERLGKKILGPDMDGKAGKGGLLDELRQEHKKENENTKVELANKITDTHKNLLFEFQKTSMRISYMSRNFERMEKSLERVTNGRYVSDKSNSVNKDDDGYYNLNSENGDQNNDPTADNYTKRKWGKRTS